MRSKAGTDRQTSVEGVPFVFQSGRRKVITPIVYALKRHYGSLLWERSVPR